MAGLLDTFFGSDDPSTADPTTGLVDSQRRQLAFNALGNIGATLLAAGQNIMPQDRARILAGLGDAPNQLAQQQLMMQRAGQARRQEMADAELSKLGNSPDFMQAVSQMPPELQAAIPALMRAGRAREAISMVGDWRQAQAREKALQTRQEAPPAGYQWVGNGQLAPIPGGPADPAQAGALAEGKRPPKDIPTVITKGMAENLNGMQKIDSTLAALNGAQGAIGNAGSVLQTWMPETGGKINNDYLNPETAKVRAMIADIGSLKIHDRSGAAVTAAETPRLKPFIPLITDSPKVAAEKLANLKAEYQNMLASQHEYYNKDNGFKPFQPAERYFSGQQPAAAPAAPPQRGSQGGSDAPPASALKEGHITNFANGQAWTLQGGQPVRVK